MKKQCLAETASPENEKSNFVDRLRGKVEGFREDDNGSIGLSRNRRERVDKLFHAMQDLDEFNKKILNETKKEVSRPGSSQCCDGSGSDLQLLSKEVVNPLFKSDDLDTSNKHTVNKESVLLKPEGVGSAKSPFSARLFLSRRQSIPELTPSGSLRRLSLPTIKE
jgi:hypothetical protein